ncbi:hypothetical protein [Pseudoxanthomonas suwonensis]|uniref:Uncharacterized protein n=1 Tax=Pseudoxanthomonas suwonensis TaxID=314722 RepID=A0A0E3UNA6_9GAMM|nr:hypothetical protein [Pseudoxanthomonas suwonensis]AKC86775.1 hypothetical protein WQ53_08395 [Pseudoxanthomonas suwonensis]
MLDESGLAIERTVSAIEAYLARHPAAADSEQGVAQWWLPAQGLDPPIEHVHRALEILWQRGVIERTAMPDGGTVYRAARRRT